MGQVRLLQSQDNGKIRLLMRQEKTLKIRANHFGEALISVCPELASDVTTGLTVHQCAAKCCIASLIA